MFERLSGDANTAGVGAIESMTGLDLLSLLPAEVQEVVEYGVDSGPTE